MFWGYKNAFFYFNFFNIFVLFPKGDPCCHCLGVKGVTPSGFAVIETDPRLPNLSQSQSDALISLQEFLCLVRHWPDHCTLLELSKRNELQRKMRSPAECLLDCDWSLAGSVALVTGGSWEVAWTTSSVRPGSKGVQVMQGIPTLE